MCNHSHTNRRDIILSSRVMLPSTFCGGDRRQPTHFTVPPFQPFATHSSQTLFAIPIPKVAYSPALPADCRRHAVLSPSRCPTPDPATPLSTPIARHLLTGLLHVPTLRTARPVSPALHRCGAILHRLPFQAKVLASLPYP